MDLLTDPMVAKARSRAHNQPPPAVDAAIQLRQRGQAQEAIHVLSAALEEEPDNPALWFESAMTMGALGQLLDADKALQRAVSLAPDMWGAWFELGRVAATLGRRDDAAYAYHQAVDIVPDAVEPRVRLAACLIGLGRLDQAEPHVRHALHLAPDSSGPRAVAARLAHRRGDLDEAWQWVAGRPADPYIVEVLATLALARKRPLDALGAVQQGVANASGPLRSLFLKFEGDLHEALGDVDRAFAAWTEANQTRNLSFSPDAHRAGIADLIARTQGPWPTSRHPDSDLPVLIVGVPRSGTTLLEQCLACHPEVAGAGELTTLRHLGVALRRPGAKDWADVLHTLPEEDWEVAAQGYLRRLRECDAGTSRVIDKMPNNLLHLGLLARMLPGTRVIRAIRNPVDTGFSCFRQSFGPGLAWATRLDWIACWIETCEQLWAHWKATLPLRFHEVRYEDLVSAPETTLRGALRFMDLPFDSAVLRPEQLDRAVATASAFEVDEPIHVRSIGRSSAYARHLAPLRDR